MPTLDQHESNSVIKMLIVGPSGAGKTGGLAPLVDAGYNLRILDFDNGLSPLRGRVKKRENLKNVNFITLRDEMQLTAGRISIKQASAFQRAFNALKGAPNSWGQGVEMPPVEEWTSQDILVVDSLSLMGKASLRMVLMLNGQINKPPEIQHYGTAMDNIENFLDIVTSDTVKSHVLVLTHLTPVEGHSMLMPEALGSKLPPKVAKPFDNMISLSITNGQRTYKTNKDGLIALKTAKPIKDTYPIETGMADIFKDLLA